MRLCRFQYQGKTEVGYYDERQIVPLAAAAKACSAATQQTLELPIGDNFTMGIDNAIIASDFINCNHIIGLHYDTFGFIKIDQREAVAKFSNNDKQLTLMQIGQTIDFK